MVTIFPVITITSELPDTAGKYKEFHFRNEERKDSFVRTLYAHRYGINFSVTTENKKPTRELLIELENDPIEYALKSLTWAKNVMDNHYANHLTEEEMAYVKKFA